MLPCPVTYPLWNVAESKCTVSPASPAENADEEYVYGLAYAAPAGTVAVIVTLVHSDVDTEVVAPDTPLPVINVGVAS